MALPITAKPDRVVSFQGTAPTSFYDMRSHSKQAKPFNEPTSYYRKRRDTLTARYGGATSSFAPYQYATVSTSAPYNNLVAYWDTDLTNNNPIVNGLLTRARGKFRDKISAQAEVLVNLAERRQAAQMMGNRLMQAYDVVAAVKRGNVLAAVHHLSLNPTSSVKGVRVRDGRPARGTRRRQREVKTQIVVDPRKVGRDLSSFWLETWFGWSPLLADIQSAIDLLESPYVNTRIRTGASEVTKTSANRQLITAGAYGDIRHTWRHDVTWRVGIGAEIAINNPNLHLANSLGMVNVASALVELVPWSWMVNWFVNVQEWLTQWTDLHGIQVVRPYHFVSCEDLAYGYDVYFSYDGNKSGYWYETTSRQMNYRRQTGLPQLQLGFRRPWRLSLTRALTASSLLVQKGIK